MLLRRPTECYVDKPQIRSGSFRLSQLRSLPAVDGSFVYPKHVYVIATITSLTVLVPVGDFGSLRAHTVK